MADRPINSNLSRDVPTNDRVWDWTDRYGADAAIPVLDTMIPAMNRTS